MPTLQCVSRDALNEYLWGWTDAEQSEAIEAHLTQCDECERTVAELESDPERLIESIRKSFEPDSQDAMPSRVSTEPEDSVIARAMVQAKQMPLGANEALPRWQPPAGDFGPYELLQPLGQGGMASVYLARHRQLGKQVAIKLLPSRPFRNDHYAARFQREIRTAGQLNHAAIVSATDAGEFAGTHFLVMEYIEGLDLSRVARLNGPLKIADVCAIMRTVAIGLSHAHAEGIVHRDIKPSNMMLSQTGEVKILDFGLAQVSLWDEVSAELTTVGQLMGTLDYMAPEQAERPEAVDYRADLYSIGATLFRLLCGRAPLAAAPDLSPLVKLRLLASHQPPRLDTLRSDAPEKLVEFVGQLLARDPSHRPASAAHVAEQLTQFTEGADLKLLIAEAMTAERAKGQTDQLAQSEPVRVGLSRTTSGTATVGLQADGAQVAELGNGGGSGGGRSRFGWWLAASMLPLFVVAGVLITLETQKGQLIIESESASVEVKLLRDGEFYETLQVKPGTNSTRLYAGKYEVILAEGSDSVAFDRSAVEIKSGKVVIARVTTPASAEATSQTESAADQAAIASLPGANNPVTSPNASVPSELLYEGKPLSAWLDIFVHERSPEELAKAIKAMAALQSDEASSTLISQALLQTLPKVDLTFDTMRSAFGLLFDSQENSSKYFQLLADELRLGNEKWRRAIFVHALQSHHSIASDPGFVADFEPMRKWIFENVLQAGQSPELVKIVASQFHSVQSNWNSAAECKQLLVDTLAAAPALGLDYWLGYAEEGRQRQSKIFMQPPTPQCAAVVESKAIEALQSPATPKKFVVQAAMLLKYFKSKDFDRTGMPPLPDTSVLSKALATQLQRMIDNPANMNEKFKLDGRFTNQWLQGANSLLGNPNDEAMTLLVNARCNFRVQTSSSSVSIGNDFPYVVFSLFDLIRTLQLEEQLLEQLNAVIRVTKQQAYEFSSAVESPFATPASSGGPTVAIFINNMDLSFQLIGTQSGSERPGEEQLLSYLTFDRCFKMLPKGEKRDGLLKELQSEYERYYLEKVVAKLDVDGDGTLSLEEAASESEQPKHLMINSATAAEIDSDKDGFLSFDELLTRMKARPPTPAPVQNKLGFEAHLEWANRQIAKYDKNRDGQLTVGEWSSMIVPPVGADANGDGFLTADEFAKARMNAAK